MCLFAPVESSVVAKVVSVNVDLVHVTAACSRRVSGSASYH